MRTIENTVYAFNELSESAQQQAIQNNTDINIDDTFWSDYIIEKYTDILESIGFCVPSIQYSGFSSQGDGASFTCEYIDFEKLLEYACCKYIGYSQVSDFLWGVKVENFLSGKVSRSNYNYVHENSVYVDLELCVDIEGNSFADDNYTRLEDSINNIVRSISQLIYSELENDFEYLNSDEVIKDTLISNEYEFYSNGLMV